MKQSDQLREQKQEARRALRERAGELAGRALLAAAREDAGSAEVEQLLAALAGLAEEARAAGLDQAAVLASHPAGGADRQTAAQVADTLLRLDQVLSDSAAELLMLAADPGMVRDFAVEARDHLVRIEAQLLALEQNPGSAEAVHTIFRGFHTIKGLSSFLELDAIREVAHEVETLLDRVRGGELEASPELIDTVLAGADYLRADLDRVVAALEGPDQAAADAGPLVSRVHALMRPGGAGLVAEDAEGAAPAIPPAKAPADSQRSSQQRRAKPSPAKTTPVDRQPAGDAAKPAEPRASRQGESKWTEPGLVEAKPVESPVPRLPKSAVKTPAASAPAPRADVRWTESKLIKVDTDKLDFLVDMVGELVIAQSMVRHDGELNALASGGLQRNLAQLARITGEVQKTAMSMRMVPIRQLFQKSARLVRDLTRRTGKQVELELSGEDTELDRTIVEELSDPLLHMIRNACDHGVEPATERRTAGKPPVARVQLKAYHQSGHIVVEISDDGRGMNRDTLIAKAASKGLLPPGAADGSQLTGKEAFNLIFEPGFSTAEQVTDISGRGVGMDVVRKQLQKLRGRVEIESEIGRGTTFLLKLPLTLAIIDGLVVGVGKERYIVPIFVVREIFRPRPENIFTVEQRGVMAKVRGSLLPVIRLSDCFGVAPVSQELTSSVVVVAEGSGRRFCLAVDELIGKQEVVIKNLGETFKRVPGVAGGAILGDGRVGLIIDIDGIGFDGISRDRISRDGAVPGGPIPDAKTTGPQGDTRV